MEVVLAFICKDDKYKIGDIYCNDMSLKWFSEGVYNYG